MENNRISFPLDDESVVAVRLKAVTGLMTDLNPNLNQNPDVNDVFIAEVAPGSQIAIFIADAPAPYAIEAGLKDIPEYGIPTGDYEVMTANTRNGATWDWDVQSEVSNITIINQDIKDIFDRYVATADIVNNLTSDATNQPLSALQGKNLKDSVDLKIPIADIVDNLTSDSTNQPLSAAQGKALKNMVDSIVKNVESWILVPESQIRDAYIDIHTGLLHDSNFYYETGGYFYIEYIFHQNFGFPGLIPEMTEDPAEWDVDLLRNFGHTINTITSTQSTVSIPKPDAENDIYTNGNPDGATLVYHVKYKNALYETGWSQNKYTSLFGPSQFNIANIISGLEENMVFASRIAAKLATSATMVEAVRQTIES